MRSEVSKRQFKKATIKDVAAQAGVSTTTVSLFVSGRESVCSPETADRIRHAVSSLHYTPGAVPRALRRRSLMTLGVCLPNPLDAGVEYGTVFFERLWRGVMYESDQENCLLLHYPESLRNGAHYDALLDGQTDGILMHEHENSRAEHLAQVGMPTVLIARSCDLPDACGAACADEAATVDCALSHLWDLGHRRIAHVAGPVGSYAPEGVTKPEIATALYRDDVAIGRLHHYVSWLERRNAFDPRLVSYPQAWSAPDAHGILRSWNVAGDGAPTAVFCANDMQALAMIAAARDLGLNVPGDLSVVGVDDSQAARQCDPPLTTVEIGIDNVGREALRTLLRLMRGAPIEQCRVSIPVSQLVVRQSTARMGA